MSVKVGTSMGVRIESNRRHYKVALPTGALERYEKWDGSLFRSLPPLILPPGVDPEIWIRRREGLWSEEGLCPSQLRVWGCAPQTLLKSTLAEMQF